MEEPYILKTETIISKMYNPKYGDNRICVCGHAYYRHFDSYADNLAIGCKYCDCDNFVEKIDTSSEIDMEGGGY